MTREEDERKEEARKGWKAQCRGRDDEGSSTEEKGKNDAKEDPG